MREEGLQWAWEKGLISGTDAYSSQPIQLINRGTWNRFEPGPDFRNACIQIGDLTWYGDIEIHVNASDWNKAISIRILIIKHDPWNATNYYRLGLNYKQIKDFKNMNIINIPFSNYIIKFDIIE